MRVFSDTDLLATFSSCLVVFQKSIIFILGLPIIQETYSIILNQIKDVDDAIKISILNRIISNSKNFDYRIWSTEERELFFSFCLSERFILI